VYVDDVGTQTANQRWSISVTRDEVIAHTVPTQDVRAMAGLHHGYTHPASSRGLGDIHQSRPVLQHLRRLAPVRIDIESDLHYMR
jgi:hypothetical protein